MIEFTDADGVKQTLDTSKPFNVAYHVDCMELLRSLPDKCFDLACVDPPYGDANVVDDIEHRNQRGRFDRYNGSQIVQVERDGRLRFHGSQKNPNDRWTRYSVEQIRRKVRPLQDYCGENRGARTI